MIVQYFSRVSRAYRCIAIALLSSSVLFGSVVMAHDATPSKTSTHAKVSAKVASVNALDEFMSGLQSLQADFIQVLRDGQGRTIEKSSGTLAIHRPDRFRWDYKKPHQQIIVADGKQLWFYDVDLEQITVRPLQQSLAGTPASLLSGSEDLRDSFKVQHVESGKGVTVVTLTPKRSDTDFKSVRIRFEAKQLQGMELNDKLDQSTVLEFLNVRRNQSIDDAQFIFTPPAGVDVIGAANATANGDNSTH